MFSNYAVRAVLIDYLKNNSAIIGVSATEVRENEWQGSAFVYPNIRVRIWQQKPSIDVNCDWTDLQMSVQCNSELASREQSEKIELAVTQLLDKKTVSDSGVKIYGLHCMAMMDSVRIDDRTWMAETMFIGKVSGV